MKIICSYYLGIQYLFHYIIFPDSETEDDLDGTRRLRLVRISTRQHDGQTSLAISVIDVESMSEMIEQMHSPDDEQTNVTEVNYYLILFEYHNLCIILLMLYASGKIINV